MPRQEPTSVNEPTTQVQEHSTDLAMILRQLEEQKAEIAKLRSLQSKSALANADSNFSNDKRKLFRYRTIDGRAIKLWENMPINDVRIIQGDIVENQVVRVHFMDDEMKEYTYKQFTDGYALSEYCRMKAFSKTDEGEFITLETEEGDLTFNIKFLN